MGSFSFRIYCAVPFIHSRSQSVPQMAAFTVASCHLFTKQLEAKKLAGLRTQHESWRQGYRITGPGVKLYCNDGKETFGQRTDAAVWE